MNEITYRGMKIQLPLSPADIHNQTAINSVHIGEALHPEDDIDFEVSSLYKNGYNKKDAVEIGLIL